MMTHPKNNEWSVLNHPRGCDFFVSRCCLFGICVLGHYCSIIGYKKLGEKRYELYRRVAWVWIWCAAAWAPHSSTQPCSFKLFKIGGLLLLLLLHHFWVLLGVHTPHSEPTLTPFIPANTSISLISTFFTKEPWKKKLKFVEHIPCFSVQRAPSVCSKAPERTQISSLDLKLYLFTAPLAFSFPLSRNESHWGPKQCSLFLYSAFSFWVCFVLCSLFCSGRLSFGSRRNLEMETAVLDSIIYRLLEVKGRPGKQVQLQESEIRQLCFVSKDIFLRQPNLLELDAPIKICGIFTWTHVLFYLSLILIWCFHVN